MPRFFLTILLLACSIAPAANLSYDPARVETFRAEHGFYASPAGAVALELENRRGWRDAQQGFGIGSVLFLGSAVEMLMTVPEDRRAGRLYAELPDQRLRTAAEEERIYRSLAEEERRERRHRSILSLLLGAGLLTGGLFASPGPESSTMFSMLGASALGGSLLSWVMPGYYQSRSRTYTLASYPPPTFQFGVSSLLGQGGRISAALLF